MACCVKALSQSWLFLTLTNRFAKKCNRKIKVDSCLWRSKVDISQKTFLFNTDSHFNLTKWQTLEGNVVSFFKKNRLLFKGTLPKLTVPYIDKLIVQKMKQKNQSWLCCFWCSMLDEGKLYFFNISSHFNLRK